MSDLYSNTGQFYLGERKAQLLVVDDQPLNVRLIHQLFSPQYDVFMARSGQEALDKCVELIPDLILLDIEMPDMHGLEVCARLKKNILTKDIPVIFVTGKQGPKDEEACWEAGCVDFVNKPVNAMTLRNRVNAHLKLKFQSDQLREIAFLDGLTQIANRRYFDERLAVDWRRCLRSQKPLSVLMIDVDFFKRYNDLYGHLQGDECLCQIAQTLKSQLLRSDDFIARYGGEEFICLLPETTKEGSVAIASRFETAIRNLAIPHENSEVSSVVTISIGCATMSLTGPDTEIQLIRLADEQLYNAKQAGRGRFAVAD